MNDVDSKVHLFSIRDNALDVYTYPLMCTFYDLKNFLSARLEYDYLRYARIPTTLTDYY